MALRALARPRLLAWFIVALPHRCAMLHGKLQILQVPSRPGARRPSTTLHRTRSTRSVDGTQCSWLACQSSFPASTLSDATSSHCATRVLARVPSRTPSHPTSPLLVSLCKSWWGGMTHSGCWTSSTDMSGLLSSSTESYVTSR
jgi:hypothetical protein